MGRAVADHNRPSVILEGARDDFGGRGAESVDKDRHRSIICKTFRLVGVDLNVAVIALHLDHGALVDEQARKLDRLAQIPAAVVPKVEDQTLDFGLFNSTRSFDTSSLALVLSASVSPSQRAKRPEG